MKITNLKKLSKKSYQRIIKRCAVNYQSIIPMVKKIMEDVKVNGDKTLFKSNQKRFGKKNYLAIKVNQKEINTAYKNVNKDFLLALEQMIKNITAVNKAQLPKKIDTIVYPENGITVFRVWRAIEKVGLYIPGGKAIYPSSVLMSVIPAQIAGCKEIIMCSPARDNGQIPAPTLVAADMIGLKQIFKIGGPEAIAAMTYGTTSIPKVYKIFGAGNTYVTAAKMLALQTISIDMPAGPSEVFIIADNMANPKFIAADLLADAEHGFDSSCVLVTTSLKVAKNTIAEIKKQLATITTKERAKESLKQYGLIAVVDNLNEAIKFCNDYAPEHLEIMARNPQLLVKRITNAGSIFLGNYTSKSSGDYATGANHILPTGGTAKMYPPLGVDSFGKWMQVQKCTKTGLKNIKKAIEIIADIEGLPAHKNSCQIRFEN